MAILNSIESVLWFLTYLGFSLVMLGAFVLLYFQITPHEDMKLIHAGNISAAIALGGAMLGFTFPLLMASYLQATFIGFLVWSAIACLVQLAVFWALYYFMPRTIEVNNAAGAVVFAIVAVCAGLMNAASFIP